MAKTTSAKTLKEILELDDQDPPSEEIIARLIKEVRMQTKLVKELRDALNQHLDLEKLTMRGAILYLIRAKKLVDRIAEALNRSRTKAVDPNDVLLEIEKLIEDYVD